MDKLAGLTGSVCVPGDKSIAHRALFFAAQAQGTTRITGLPDGDDVITTLHVIERLGAGVSAGIDADGTRFVEVNGWGDAGPSPRFSDEAVVLDCGNSGTTARFLLGMLAGYPGIARIDGDASLRKRPMRRLLEPLSCMGLTCISDTWPIEVRGMEALRPIAAELPVASAQMKTALLFAATRAIGESCIMEPAPSRDHTERLAGVFGIEIDRPSREEGIVVHGPQVPRAPKTPIAIPGDPSSAAFWIAAASCIPGSELTIEDVCLNSTRLGFVKVLQEMGASVFTERIEDAGSEPIGRIHAKFAEHLVPCGTSACASATLIDEVPVLALMCAFARGDSLIRNVGELRHKECDRLHAIIEVLAMCGVHANVIENPDGSTDLLVSGEGALHVPDGIAVSAYRDHRIAMMWAVAAAACHAQVRLATEDIEAIAVSYPGFLDEFSHHLGYAPVVCVE